MTAPRQVIAGRTYLISRRCTQREHLLRPDAQVEQIYLYCLGDALARFGITLHGYMAMSNHQHIVVRDNRGNFPEFLAHFHKMVAKALNKHWGRWENLWATEQPNAVYLVEKNDRFDKLIYLLANPVAAHLVERLADWPGACSFRQHLTGATRKVKRPRGFFRADGVMPDEVALRVERPDGFESLSEHEWVEKIACAIRGREEKAKAERMKTGRQVLGRKGVLRMRHTDRPRTVARRRRLRPNIACRTVARRISELAALRSFHAEYQRARPRWIGGDWRTIFPPGTYALSKLGARCAKPSEWQPTSTRGRRRRSGEATDAGSR